MSTLCEVGQAETKATMYRLHVGLKHDTDELIYETLCYLPYMQNTSCKTPDWMDHKLESRFPGEISTISDDTTLKAESKEELKSLSMKVIGESEEVGLILNIQKAKTLASSPTTSWQIDS